MKRLTVLLAFWTAIAAYVVFGPRAEGATVTAILTYDLTAHQPCQLTYYQAQTFGCDRIFISSFGE